MRARSGVGMKGMNIVIPYLDEVTGCLGDKVPRVKWEAARVIGNIAKTFPKEAEKAIEGLLKNTVDKGTVVHWSTAFAICEIAKFNDNLRSSLKLKINEL